MNIIIKNKITTDYTHKYTSYNHVINRLLNLQANQRDNLLIFIYTMISIISRIGVSFFKIHSPNKYVRILHSVSVL